MSDEILGLLAQLPSDLAYLAVPAMRYGIYRFDSDVDDFLSSASEEELNELAGLAERVRLNRHFPRVNKWIDQYGMTNHEEVANLYFLFGVMDAANLKFDEV